MPLLLISAILARMRFRMIVVSARARDRMRCAAVSETDRTSVVRRTRSRHGARGAVLGARAVLQRVPAVGDPVAAQALEVDVHLPQQLCSGRLRRQKRGGRLLEWRDAGSASPLGTALTASWSMTRALRYGGPAAA